MPVKTRLAVPRPLGVDDIAGSGHLGLGQFGALGRGFLGSLVGGAGNRVRFAGSLVGGVHLVVGGPGLGCAENFGRPDRGGGNPHGRPTISEGVGGIPALGQFPHGAGGRVPGQTGEVEDLHLVGAGLLDQLGHGGGIFGAGLIGIGPDPDLPPRQRRPFAFRW